MMTTNLFVIANVKQLRTGGSFRILLSFFRTSWSVGFLNSAIFNSFKIGLSFGTILMGLRNFGGGVWSPQNTPSVRHWGDGGIVEYKMCDLSLYSKFVWKISHSKKTSSSCNRKLILVFHVKYPFFWPDVNKIWIFVTDFKKKSSNI